VHKHGHVAELLFTFGLAYIIEEAIHLVWGRAVVDYAPPPSLDGPLFTLFGSSFPLYRGFMAFTAIAMLVATYVVLTRTRIGLVIQAALSHPQMVEALGHNVPRVFMLTFGGGAALAGLAGAVGGPAFVTDPGMAAAIGPIVFVIVVVGGMGSLAGAFVASLLIGLLQTFSVALNWSLAGLLAPLGVASYPVLVHRPAVYAPGFLPTLGHPYAVAVRFALDGLITGGLAPPRQRPCWAH